MSVDVYKQGSRIAKDVVRVHRGGNRIDGVSHDNELFFTDLPKPNRSKIDLSFDRKLSFGMGYLIPVLAQECVPGDTFHIAQAHNLIMPATIAPLYQRIDYRTWYFFVPTRLVDDTWKDYITYKNTNYTLPYFTGKQVSLLQNVGYVHQLLDYLDIPVNEYNWNFNERHLLGHVLRCYNLIWNEFYRDEFKQTEIPVYKTGGQMTSTELESFILRKIGWEKDYFTTCQTAPQIGPDVPIPVGISGTGSITGVGIEADGYLRVSQLDGSNPSAGDMRTGSGSDDSTKNRVRDVDGNGLKYVAGLKATGSGSISGLATTGTINELRMANHLQRYRDRLQIAGQRYNEQILAEFGVVVPDYRIQRPEYIGGYASPVAINKINQNNAGASSPLGSYAGQLFGDGRMDYIHYDAKEHGYIIGLSCVVPRTAYMQGIPRSFIKDTIYDYYHPEFATLGDQKVYDDEIYVKSGNSNSVFGYQQRYSEYKYPNGGHGDAVNGAFRSTLDFWHMARKFDSSPSLNDSFIEADPTTRIFAVDNQYENVYAEIYQQIDSVRPMPISVVPNLENDV